MNLKSIRRFNPVVLSVLLLLGVLGAYLVIQATPFGLGLRDDSFRYLSAAENLARGSGYGRWDAEGTFRPLTNFPPLYSSLLAAFEKGGFQAYRGARATSILFFAGLVVLVGLWLYSETSSAWAAIAGSLFVVTSASILSIYTWVISEPLSTFLMMLSLVCITAYLKYPYSRRMLVYAIVVSALALLTRYANLAVIVTGVAAIMFYSRQPMRQRVKDSLAYFLLSAIPLSLFLARNALGAGSIANRPAPYLHLPDISVLEQGISTILHWLLPGSASQNVSTNLAQYLVIMALGIFLVSGFFLFIRRPQSGTPGGSNSCQFMAIVAWLFFAIYLVMMLSTLLWFDRLLPLNDRILSPLYLAGVVVFVNVLVLATRRRARSFSISLIAISVFFLAVKANETYSLVDELGQDGLGYASAEWRGSRAIEYLKALPEVPIYSNDIPAAYLLAGRIVHSIPISTNPSSLTDNPNYLSEVNRMRHDLTADNGYLVIIGSDPLHRIGEEAMSLFTQGVLLEALFPDGAVFHSEQE